MLRNTDAQQSLYLLSKFSHAYNLVIDRGGVAPGHGKYVVYCFNATDKRFLTVLVKTVQLPGTATNDSQMFIHAAMNNTDISLARVFQKHLSDPTHSHGLLII